MLLTTVLSFPMPKRLHWPRAAACLALLAAATAVGLPAAAQERGPARQPALPTGVEEVRAVEGITEYRLANGLQVLLAPDASKPSTTVNLTYRVGSRHENYGETGMAHLLEHLIFKGTPTTPNALAEFGKRGLRANGTTWTDRTNYFASFTANDETLRWFLSWHADAMVNSFVRREDLDSEMTVVRNELEMGENSPFRVLLQRSLGLMYQWHNYGKSTIGARSDLENVAIENLQAFYKRWYQPDNATLIVAGRFDPMAVLMQVAESFGAIPRPQRPLPASYTLDDPQDGERSVTVRRSGGAPLILMGHHVPPGAHPDFAAVELLAGVLGSAPAGRMHKALVEAKLAAQVYAFPFTFAEPSPFFTAAQLAPGQSPAQARAAMAAVFDALAKTPITAAELERARVQWLNEWEQGFGDPEVVGVQLSEAIALGDWRLYFLRRDQVRALTLADLQRVATTWFRPDNRTVAVFEPTAQPQRAPAPARVDIAELLRDYRPAAELAQAEAFDATPANLESRTQRVKLASGLQVALLPKGTRGRAVRGQLQLRFGDLDSLRGQGGQAELLAALLDKGVAAGPRGEPALSRQELADRFDALRAKVSFGGGGQTLRVDWQTTREHVPALLALLGRVLREPALPEAALDEVRSQRLAGLARARQEPEELTRHLLVRHGNPYPASDPRHVPTFDEQEARLRAANVAALRAFHRRFVSAAAGELALVGDFDPALARSAAEAAFGAWRAPAAGPAVRYARIPQPLYERPPARLVQATPDKANAAVRFLMPLALNDTHPDAEALEIANHAFGGSLSSRLWMRIRERDGLSYGVGTALLLGPFEPHAILRGAAIFAPQNQARVEAALREEFERIAREGLTEAELAEARTGWLNDRRLARAQDEEQARLLADQGHLGRDWAFEQRRDERVAALTLAQVNAVWRRWVDAGRLVFVWGGDFKPAP